MVGVNPADDSRHTSDSKVISPGAGVIVGGSAVMVGVDEGGSGLGGIVGVPDGVGVAVLVGEGNSVAVGVTVAV